jgi:hypothetical protein
MSGGSMTPTELQDHIYKTYFSLRRGLCFLAFVFPLLLLLIGLWKDIPFQASISDYYFAFAPQDSKLRDFPGRVVFVGILFALGFFLILYRGFSKTKDQALDIAGLSLLVIALFPTQTPSYCDNCGSNTYSVVHNAAGGILFLCTAFVAWACSEETLVQMPDPPRRYFRTGYDALAAAMFVLPIAVFVMASILKIPEKIFIVEYVGIAVFALFWLLKTIELSLGDGKVEKEAIAGQKTEFPLEKRSLRKWAARLLDKDPFPTSG